MFDWMKRGVLARFDVITPLCIVLLTTTGICFIYSAQIYSAHGSAGLLQTILTTSPGDWPRYFMQIAWLGVSAIAYIVVSRIDYKIFLRHSHWLWLAGFLALAMLLIPGVGLKVYGATRWIKLGPLTFQPSEAAKLSVLVMCASILARTRVGSIENSWWTLLKLALAAGFPMLLIFLQPDLGSALVLPPLVFSLLYASNLSKKFFAAALIAFVVVVGVVAWDTYSYSRFLAQHNLSPMEDRGAYERVSWFPLKDYQRNRVLAFVNPYGVDKDISWQLRQSLITVGSGGFSGKGWTQGTQAKLGYLPQAAAHNDFIFSVIAEESGFLGSVTVLGLFGLVLANGVRIASMARDRFGTLLALGVTVVFAVHVFVNVGMTIGLVPITGIPLPFLSYGGSFLLSCCVLQGLVQSVYRFRKEF